MEQTAGTTKHGGIGRGTWFLAVVAVAALIAIAAIAVVLTGTSEEAVYEPGSPEAVVQAYAEAWETGDVDAAWEMLTPRAQTRVQLLEFRNAISWADDTPARVWIEERRDYDDRVVLVLAVEWTWDGLFGRERETQPLRVTLVESDGLWRIDTPIVGFHPW